MMTGAKPGLTAAVRALTLAGLVVQLENGERIVEDIDLRLMPREILGIVGESGAGKTTMALALLGYSKDGVRISAGELEIAGVKMEMNSSSMRSARGSQISYVPQDPGQSLNPSFRIGAAIEDILKAHRLPVEREVEVKTLLTMVGLPASTDLARRYPHQLSGGQQQRILIAIALSCQPAVVVFDEPTTGLDVVTQDRILSELVRLRDEHRLSMVYVTHDLAVVGQVADRIAVMYAGRIVEEGPAAAILRRPRHPYTRGLLTSIPDHVRPRKLEAMPGIAISLSESELQGGCAFVSRCSQRQDRCAKEMPPLRAVGGDRSVRCFFWEETPEVRGTQPKLADSESRVAESAILQVEGLCTAYGSRAAAVVVARDISFAVARGQCVALVGESGSGKTTIARAIAGLHPAAAGRLMLDGKPLPSLVRRRTRDERRRIQLIAQNPADALNPRHTVEDAIGRVARMLRGVSRRETGNEVRRQLDAVRLPARLATRYPSELSGGERQRVALARALAAGPDLLLCDEITSALDVSVQAAVLEVLNDLRSGLGLSLLFITHNLGVVAEIADEMLVLHAGTICERGSTRTVLRAATHPYTQQLLSVAPSISVAIEQHDHAVDAAAEASHRA
jgi:peptide/nickel transport system ATP-binding protein